MTDSHRRVRPGRLHVLLLLAVASIGASAWQNRTGPAGDAMTYAVDPAWPRPLPAPKNAAGQTQQWGPATSLGAASTRATTCS